MYRRLGVKPRGPIVRVAVLRVFRSASSGAPPVIVGAPSRPAPLNPNLPTRQKRLGAGDRMRLVASDLDRIFAIWIEFRPRAY